MIVIKEEKQMAKYKIIFDGVEEDDIYDSYEDAEEAANEMTSDCKLGAEILHMSNPGDYEYDEDDYDDPDIEIVEIEE